MDNAPTLESALGLPEGSFADHLRQQTAKEQADGPLDAADCSAIPAYFAGVFCTEDTVTGGTGQTPDEAVEDYFANHADDEIDYYTEMHEEGGTITVEVFSVYEPGPDDEGGWKWMCGERVECREYQWRIEPGDGDMPRIVYSQNAGLSHGEGTATSTPEKS